MGDTNSETLLKNDVEQETHKETFREMLLLLRDWAFMLFAVSNFLTSLGYPIPYTFVLDNALKLGLTETQGSYLVGLIGISNTIARVVLGALSQKLNRLFPSPTCLETLHGCAGCFTLQQFLEIQQQTSRISTYLHDVHATPSCSCSPFLSYYF